MKDINTKDMKDMNIRYIKDTLRLTEVRRPASDNMMPLLYILEHSL